MMSRLLGNDAVSFLPSRLLIHFLASDSLHLGTSLHLLHL